MNSSGSCRNVDPGSSSSKVKCESLSPEGLGFLGNVRSQGLGGPKGNGKSSYSKGK